MKKAVGSHLRQYWLVYITLSCTLLAGTVFGALGITALDEERHAALARFLNNLLSEQPETLSKDFLLRLAGENFIMMAGIWVLGLTVIGTPLVYIIVFVRGFIVGFTAAFLIQVKKVVGVGWVVITIGAPSLLLLPCLLFGGGMAVIFSLLLLQGKLNGKYLRRELISYSLASFLIAIGALGAGALQGYFSLVGSKFLGF